MPLVLILVARVSPKTKIMPKLMGIHIIHVMPHPPDIVIFFKLM